jgi:hypothetical protein
MPRGGFRPGAGRKKNSPNRATRERQARVAATGTTPLDYLLEIMRDEKADPVVRLDAAKSAAPYIHPRLSGVNFKDISPRRSIAEMDARLVELLTGAMRRHDQGRIVALERNSPPVIEGDCTTDDGVAARPVGIGGRIDGIE